MPEFERKIKIGSRASKLALIQANEIRDLLIKKANISASQIEIIEITTSGDKIKDISLAEIGGKGLFIKELEENLVEKKIDIAVHSAKDVTPLIHSQTILSAFTKRLDANDYFISKKYQTINDLPLGATVGTSSARRKAILLSIRSDLKINVLRGNVDTRLRKIFEEKFDASVIALCAIQRIGLEIENERIISTNTMIPAVGQGSLAIQIRCDDDICLELSKYINDFESYLCIKAERAFLRELNASCKSPIGVYAAIKDDNFIMKTAIYDIDGSAKYCTDKKTLIDRNSVDANFLINIAKSAAQETIRNAKSILERIC